MGNNIYREAGMGNNIYREAGMGNFDIFILWKVFNFKTFPKIVLLGQGKNTCVSTSILENKGNFLLFLLTFCMLYRTRIWI